MRKNSNLTMDIYEYLQLCSIKEIKEHIEFEYPNYKIIKTPTLNSVIEFDEFMFNFNKKYNS